MGHLAVQFGSKFGYKVAAIGRGSENAGLARAPGASAYIDSQSTNAAEELQKLGGAQVILATVIAAGFVDTPLSASLLGDDLENRRNHLRATLPIGRVVGPADVASLAVHTS